MAEGPVRHDYLSAALSVVFLVIVPWLVRKWFKPTHYALGIHYPTDSVLVKSQRRRAQGGI